MKRSFLRAVTDAINPYAWVMAIRNKAFDKGVLKSRKFDVPTICIGNISVGGTGKTPHTEYIIRLLKERYAIAVLSRGYGRKSKGYVKASASSTMELIGDEPFQIKEKFHEVDIAVCEKRVEGIEKLLAGNGRLQAILLDDAFQHRYVKVGLNILLIDSNRPVWHDNVMPFGRLRESIAAVKRADIVIFTKCKEITDEQKSSYRRFINETGDVPVYFSTVRYSRPYKLFDIAGRDTGIDTECRILLVTGIAKPQPLKEELEKRGAKVELMQYADHHNFTNADLDDIVKQYKNGGYTMIVTTEKDATRMKPHKETLKSISDSIYVMPIEVEFLDGEEKLFNQNIYNYVTENSRNS